MAARPLLTASLAFVCGAGLGAWLPQEPAAWAWAAAILLAGWVALLGAGAEGAGSAAGIAVFAVLGVLRCQAELSPLYAGAEQIAEGEAVATGRLARPAQTREGETLLFLEGARLHRVGPAAAAGVPVAIGTTGALALPLQAVVAGACGNLEVGDLVVARGAVRPPRGDRNLGWFPGPVVPRQSRNSAWLIVNSPVWVHRVGHDPGSGPAAAVLRWRAAAHRFWNSRPGAPGAILDALTTGERAAIPRDVQEAFTGSGLAHVLAISGMNVAFLAALVFLLLRRALALCQPLVLRVPAQPLAAGLTLPALWFFLLFSGGQIPVGRAVLTSGLALAAALAWRRIAPAEAFAAAALAIVASDPRALFSPSFQLSFAATAALLLVAPRLAPPHRRRAVPWRARALERVRLGLRSLFTASLAASAATAPLVAFHFQQVSLIGLPANLVAVPLTGLVVLPLAWLTLAAQTLPQPLADAASGVALRFAEALIAVAQWFAAPSWATVATARPPPLLTLLLLGAVATALPPATDRMRRARAGTLAASAAAACCWAIATHGPGLLVAFLDVGQGLAVAIRAPGGATLLYDAGPRWRDYDAGERVVVPALRRLGAWRLEGFSVSHGHPDHAGGSAAVRAAFAPSVGLAGAESPEPGVERQLGGGLTLRVLGPPARPAAAGDENDRSLALLLTLGATGVVLTGDAGTGAVPGILAAARPHPAHVALQAPHHGGSPEACGALAAALGPEVSVIAVGRNGYGHPRPGAVAALAACGSVARTDRDGAVFLRSDGARICVRTWRDLSADRTWVERWRWLAAGW